MIWIVVWVVLMLFWLCFGIYNHDPANRISLGNTIIPWACVLILGLILFGTVSSGPVR